MKNYTEAKKNFIEAKNRLALVKNENAKILATDIAMGIAIIDDQSVSDKFKENLPSDKSSDEGIKKNENSGNQSVSEINFPLMNKTFIKTKTILTHLNFM